MNTQKKADHRILIIDDNAAIHEDFRKILRVSPRSHELEKAERALFNEPAREQRKLEFHVDCAFQGREGVDMVRKALAHHQPYALAFVDIRMPPGWDGIETTAKLWQHDPDLQVVLCTAYSDYSWDDITSRLKNTDNMLILKKPFDNAEVLQLAHALSKKSLLARQTRKRTHHH